MHMVAMAVVFIAAKTNLGVKAIVLGSDVDEETVAVAV